MALVLSAQQIAGNIDSELNTRGLSLRGDDHIKLLRLRRVVKGESGKEVSETGEVKYKKEFTKFLKLPLELRRIIWNRANPAIHHRVISLQLKWDTEISRPRKRPRTSITYPSSVAINLMLACKEAKNAIYEAYSATPGATATASLSTVGEDSRALEVASLRKGGRPSLATQRVNYNDDIFYLVNGLYAINDRQSRGRIDVASITTLMLRDAEFNVMIKHPNLHRYEANLQSLSALKSIIVLDFKHCKGRSVGNYEYQDGYGWTLIKTPTSFERFDKNAINKDRLKKFQDWVDKIMKPLPKLKEVAVYYADASDYRVGPCLAIKNDERYEYSGGRWISTATGLEAEGEQ